MKIIMTEGCTAFGTTIDGKNIEDLKLEEYDKILDRVIAKIRNDVLIGCITFDSLIGIIQYDDYKTLTSEPCDTCGDDVTQTTWEI